MKIAWLAAAVLAAAHAFGAPAADGPYVVRNSAGQWEARYVDAGSGAPRAAAVAVGGAVTVAAVDDVPAFKVVLRKPAALAPDVVRLAARTPLFVVADTHGEYAILVGMLRKQGIVGARLEWTFGRGHLVILGDVFDRGSNQTEILWLLYALEGEARRAGGGVHFVLGNHETMALRGDARYLHPKYVATAQALGVASYSELFGANTLLGQWLRTRPAVQQVGSFLCLHAGVSRALLDRGITLAEINGAIRAALNDAVPADAAARERAEFLFGHDGPLWYRGYFPGQPDFVPATSEDVELALRRFGVARILVGHTIVPTITPLFDGKVIAVQVYPRRDASGAVSFESLWVKNGALLRALPDGTTQPL